MTKWSRSLLMQFGLAATLVACELPATHTYPRNTISPRDVYGVWRARLESRSIYVTGGRWFSMTGESRLTLRPDNTYLYEANFEVPAGVWRRTGSWRVCRDAEGHSAVCLEEFSICPDTSAGRAAATHYPYLVLEGSGKPKQGIRDLSLSTPDIDDYIIWFHRQPESR